MKIPRHCFQQIAVAIFTIIAFYPNANAQIVPDTTLPNNSSVTSQDNIKLIEGGTQAQTNLFHSFEEFSVPTNSTAYFNNTANIQNIITRITGKSISNIDGILRANGTANFFLINPNGIVFGENAALNIGGSFFATTASSINFTDGAKFSATQLQAKPLLTINVPAGLQFGVTSAPIRNQSKATIDNPNNTIRPTGLQVSTGKTLALIGGDVILEGGNLSVDSGRIELAAVASNSLVNLNSTDKSWFLEYEGVDNFRNIQLIQRNADGLKIQSSVEVRNSVDSGNIQIRGAKVELIGFNIINLINQIDRDIIDSGNLNIDANKLVVRDGAQIRSSNNGNSLGANITVNASDSVEIIGGFISPIGYIATALTSNTVAIGKAGNININTSRILIKDGATIGANSIGNKSQNSQFFAATGAAGNLTVNASDSVELIGSFETYPSSLTASSLGFTNAGNLTISTKQLIVRD